MGFATDVADDLVAIGQTHLATLRSAEFGFFGVVVDTRTDAATLTVLSAGTRFFSDFGDRGSGNWFTVADWIP